MSFVVFQDSSRFTRFFMTDLLTDELIQVPESVFDECVIKYRNLYDLEYDGPNAQNFLCNGRIEARRER